ncbi:hypothetical protein [Hymenobacter koreensis]|uniref:DUF1772 domain-containing protein n=1 Tax=Hymenobacter koreensis TaxID=1084523 RepID=A0ABP8IY27_9BACT
MPVKLLLLLAFGLSAYLTGLIWVVQLVHYPAFAQVPPAAFRSFHQAHMARMGWVVMAPMVAELGLAAWLFWQGRSPAAAWGLGLVVAIWLVTFLISVPLHNRLAAVGYDAAAIASLVRTNWLRTALWTVRLGLTGAMLYQAR